MNLRLLVQSSFCAVICLAGQAWAATYPLRAITVTVPYGAGGTTDRVARKFSNLLSVELKQPVVVLNQPGASGTLQLGNLAKAKPDGYTLGFYSYSTATFTSQLMKVPYSREDFELLGGIGEVSYGVIAPADSPINSIKDLIEQSKTSKGIFFGVIGAPNNFPFLQLQKLTGGKFDQVTYKSSAESVRATVGKQVDVALHSPSEYAELVKAGKLKVIASASERRLPWFPNVPTIKEQGYDNISVTGIIGIAAPKGVPQEVKSILEPAILRVTSSKEYRDFLADNGMSDYSVNAADFSKRVGDGFEAMRNFIKTHDIRN